MNIIELKKLLKHSTSVIILDNGEPAFVIMDYKVYRDLALDEEGEDKESIAPDVLAVGQTPALAQREAQVLERLNKEILALKDQIESEEKKAEEIGQE